jgi:hypothetical protein
MVANINEGKGACKNIIQPFTVPGERFAVRITNQSAETARSHQLLC